MTNTAKAKARPILVSWIYNDASRQSYCELVMATPEQEAAIKARLEALDPGGGDPPIVDLYVGRMQAHPTSYETFMANLGQNEYIAAAEAALNGEA